MTSDRPRAPDTAPDLTRAPSKVAEEWLRTCLRGFPIPEWRASVVRRAVVSSAIWSQVAWSAPAARRSWATRSPSWPVLEPACQRRQAPRAVPAAWPRVCGSVVSSRRAAVAVGSSACWRRSRWAVPLRRARVIGSGPGMRARVPGATDRPHPSPRQVKGGARVGPGVRRSAGRRRCARGGCRGCSSTGRSAATWCAGPRGPRAAAPRGCRRRRPGGP